METKHARAKKPHIVWLQNVGMNDIAEVGGKNASLGELIRSVSPKGVRVPGGFVITVAAYHHFLRSTGIEVYIHKTLDGLDSKNLKELARCGTLVRDKIKNTKLPQDLYDVIVESYAKMEKEYGKNVDVAVRSSATAEDLPGASFAGEHETYLGIRGPSDVAEAARWAFASLFTDRAISYRADKGFRHEDVALSVGVQKMVRSDKGASGVMFTLDTESGFKDLVLINGSYGLGEMIVQGKVTPDEFLVLKSKIGKAKSPIIGKRLGMKDKRMIYASGKSGIHQTVEATTTAAEMSQFVLSEKEIETLAKWAVAIEDHYSKRAGHWTPMDIEWARDGISNQLFVVQARPETVQVKRDASEIIEYHVSNLGHELVRGISVGSKVATGMARVITDPHHIKQFKKGEVLVAPMTDPDWEPVMKLASAVITDHGGRTSHAAIVSRELGIPAIVGTEKATHVIKTGMQVTVDTTGSFGRVCEGTGKITTKTHSVKNLPKTRTKIMLNIASPDAAFERSFLPVAGVGLAREEFIIAAGIGIHPLALLNFKKLPKALQAEIQQKIRGWNNPVQFYIDNLAYGIAKIAGAFYPRPVIVRFSDFKSNEYSSLLGGKEYEPEEANPMLGWRGASRYYDPKFEKAFALECKAMAKVRLAMGLDNVIPMVPFCRTVKEAAAVTATMKKHGLVPRALAKKGDKKATSVYMMCEIPSNVVLAEKFLNYFDGMSIGSNDLTQLTLGVDRDSGTLGHIGNEDDEAVRTLIASVIAVCRKRGKYSGICGQGPSDLPGFAQFLVEAGIESMSLNPDVVIHTVQRVAKIEKKIRS